MAKTFDAAVKLVERIPDIKNTQWFFRSLVARLNEEDRQAVVENLLDYVTRVEVPANE